MGYNGGMPSSQSKRGVTQELDSESQSRRCHALTTSGVPCKRRVVPGLTVCQSHGGGTVTSVRASKRARASQQAVRLWGISPDTGPLSVKEHLSQLARNKITDITALRLKISAEDESHIGMLTESLVQVEYDIGGTTQTKSGTQTTLSKQSGTSIWVQELHKAEMELIQILRLLHDVSGDTTTVDLHRIRIQTAREAARILKAFPGISVDAVAAEVTKHG